MLLRFLPLALAAAALSACSETPVSSLDGGLPVDALAPTGRIALDDLHPISLAFSEERSFSARWLGVDERPVVGQWVSFALEGTPKDSSLGTLGAMTDAQGRAHGRVRGGTMSTSFRIRISAPGATPALIDVGVGGPGLGSLRVRVEGPAERSFTARTIQIFDGSVSCDRVTGSAPLREQVLPGAVLDTWLFVALPSQVPFTIVARAEGVDRAAIGSACIAGVALTTAMEREVVLALEGEPLQVSGEYDAQLVLTPGAATREQIRRVSEEIEAALASADASALFDALQATLTELGQDAAAQQLALERSLGAEAALSQLLASADVELTSALIELVREVEAHFGNLQVNGTLAVASSDTGLLASFTQEGVLVGTAVDTPLLADLSTRMVQARRPAEAQWLAARDELRLDALRVELPLGRLLLAALDAVVTVRGSMSRRDLLLDVGVCEVLGSYMAGLRTISCPTDCVQAGCARAIDGLLAELDQAALALDAARAELTVSGTLSCADTDADLAVDRLETSAVSGTWAGPESSEVVATSAGARRVQ